MMANREPGGTNEKRKSQMTANREPRTKNAKVLLGHHKLVYMMDNDTAYSVGVGRVLAEPEPL